MVLASQDAAIGSAAGGGIGLLFGGVGAVPGAAIGGAVGGVLGNVLGKKKPKPVPFYKKHEKLLIGLGVLAAAGLIYLAVKQ